MTEDTFTYLIKVV